MTRLGCGARLIKISLICFNFIFFILGSVILAVGIYVLVDPKFTYLKNITNFDVQNTAASAGINLSYLDKCGIAFIVLGTIIFLISFIGCCGALKQVRFLLVMYSIILLIVLLAEIGLGIFTAVYSNKFKSVIEPTLTESIKYEYYGEMQNGTIVSIAWDVIMYNFECCGVKNSSDFNQVGNVWTDRNNSLVPKSCCVFPNKYSDWSGVIPNSPYYPECVTNPNSNISNYQVGCYGKINGYVNEYSAVFIGCAIGVGVILTLGVIFGFCLCKMITNAQDYV